MLISRTQGLLQAVEQQRLLLLLLLQANQAAV
jgi:hypothetical protein